MREKLGIKDKNGKIIKLGDFLKSSTFPENPLKTIKYNGELAGSVLPEENGINALYEKNDEVEIITKKEKDKMIKEYDEICKKEKRGKYAIKKGYGYICHHEACWGEKKKFMDTDTVWENPPKGATGCIKIKDDIF